MDLMCALQVLTSALKLTYTASSCIKLVKDIFQGAIFKNAIIRE